MPGEGKNTEYKLRFDPGDSRAKTKLVKHIVAMANSGGGEIIFGRDETSIPGLPQDIARQLDSAALTDYVEKYVDKGLIGLHHDFRELPNGNFVITIRIDPSTHPIVLVKDGTWSGMHGKDMPEFHKGDVWMRHGSKSERLSQADMDRVVREAFERGINQVISGAQIIRKAGPDSSVEFRAGKSDVIRSPRDLLRLALSRRELNLPYLLSGKELLWLFALHRSFTPNISELELIIESALRRPATLYAWLRDPCVSPDIIRRILFRLPHAEDRDKSDAASSAIELAAFFLEQDEAGELLAQLKASRYAHFRRAAKAFRGQDATKRAFVERIERARIDGTSLIDLSQHALEKIANELASKALSEPTLSRSRKLADVIRCIWAKEQGWVSPSGEERVAQ